MSQITIYVPEVEARAIRQAARADKRSVSEWARERMSAGFRSSWPADYWNLVGAIRDEAMKRPEQPLPADDRRRETF